MTDPVTNHTLNAFGMCQLLREAGWMVASHNDYLENGERHTYWAFSRNGNIIDSEGQDDTEALMGCLQQAKKFTS